MVAWAERDPGGQARVAKKREAEARSRVPVRSWRHAGAHRIGKRVGEIAWVQGWPTSLTGTERRGRRA
jgi:hypothetical protein